VWIWVFFSCYVSCLSPSRQQYLISLSCSKNTHRLHVKYTLTYLIAMRCVQQFE